MSLRIDKTSIQSYRPQVSVSSYLDADEPSYSESDDFEEKLKDIKLPASLSHCPVRSVERALAIIASAGGFTTLAVASTEKIFTNKILYSVLTVASFGWFPVFVILLLITKEMKNLENSKVFEDLERRKERLLKVFDELEVKNY